MGSMGIGERCPWCGKRIVGFVETAQDQDGRWWHGKCARAYRRAKDGDAQLKKRISERRSKAAREAWDLRRKNGTAKLGPRKKKEEKS